MRALFKSSSLYPGSSVTTPALIFIVGCPQFYKFWFLIKFNYLSNSLIYFDIDLIDFCRAINHAVSRLLSPFGSMRTIRTRDYSIMINHCPCSCNAPHTDTSDFQFILWLTVDGGELEHDALIEIIFQSWLHAVLIQSSIWPHWSLVLIGTIKLVSQLNAAHN